MQQHESALVRDIQIAGQRQRRLAFDLIAKDRDGREIAAQRQLVAGKQRAGRDREVLHASPATEAGRAFEAAAIVGVNAPAMRADRLAVRIGPTDTAERRFRLIVLHRENGRQRKAFGGGGKEKMLGHRNPYRLWKLSYPIGIDSQAQNIICDRLSHAIGA